MEDFNEENYNGAEKEEKPKKKGYWGKIVASGFLIGAIAGGTMVGIDYVGNNTVNKTQTTTVLNTDTTDTSTASSSGNTLTSSTDSNTTIEDIASSTLPAMVIINGTTTVSQGYIYGGEYEATTSGTGIIIGRNDDEIQILTNAHVISDVSNLTCTFVDNSSAEASIKGSSSSDDIALISVKVSDLSDDTKSSIAVAPLSSESENVKVGEQVVAIGNARGEGQSVTVGYISAKDRTITANNQTFDKLFLTDAAINSGNSGGALLNMSGEVIAINFAKGNSESENMGYAIPIYKVKDLINQFVDQTARSKVSESEMGYVGVVGATVEADETGQYNYPSGVLIREVASGSPADKAGLQMYDIITQIDDTSVTSMTSFKNTLAYYKSGETVKLTYYHLNSNNQYEEKSIDLTLGSRTN